MLSVNGVLTITSPSPTSTEVLITYTNGTLATITSAVQDEYNQRDIIVDSIISVLNVNNDYVTYEPVLPKVISSITITV